MIIQLLLFFFYGRISSNSISSSSSNFDSFDESIYESAFNVSQIQISSHFINSTENNHTEIKEIFIISQTVESNSWSILVLFQKNLKYSATSTIGDPLYELETINNFSDGEFHYGIILEYHGCIYMSETRKNYFNFSLENWEVFTNHYVPDVSSSFRSAWCTPLEYPIHEAYLVYEYNIGFWSLVKCNNNNTNCHNQMMMVPFKKFEIQNYVSEYFYLFSVPSMTLLSYLVIFMLCTLCCQNCKNCPSCHKGESIHDTISSSIHDANSILKRIFNVSMAAFLMLLLISNSIAFIQNSKTISTEVAFAFECIGIIFLYLVCCFPGGKAYREYYERTNSLTFGRKSVDAFHSTCATLFIFSFLISNAIYTFQNQPTKNFLTRMNYAFWIVSVFALFFFLVSLKKGPPTLLYLSESSAISSLLLQNLINSWSRNNLNHFKWDLSIMILIIILFLYPAYCSYVVFTENKNEEGQEETKGNSHEKLKEDYKDEVLEDHKDDKVDLIGSIQQNNVSPEILKEKKENELLIEDKKDISPLDQKFIFGCGACCCFCVMVTILIVSFYFAFTDTTKACPTEMFPFLLFLGSASLISFLCSLITVYCDDNFYKPTNCVLIISTFFILAIAIFTWGGIIVSHSDEACKSTSSWAVTITSFVFGTSLICCCWTLAVYWLVINGFLPLLNPIYLK